MTNSSKQLIADAVKFFSHHDEDAFFEWLDKLDCVVEYRGEGTQLLITLTDDHLEDDALRELLALFYRYGVDLSQFSKFMTPENQSWFGDSHGYWHSKVFVSS